MRTVARSQLFESFLFAHFQVWYLFSSQDEFAEAITTLNRELAAMDAGQAEATKLRQVRALN